MLNKRLAVVISCVDAPQYAQESVKWAKLNSTPELTDVILLDNGSNPELPPCGEDRRITLAENVGGNAALPVVVSILDTETVFPRYDVVAFIHCDLFIREQGWDKRVLEAFDADEKLALLGFVGSDQMDEHGGRGSGTRLNYQGHFYEGFGATSTAEAHGMRSSTLAPAANLDHCSLVFRRSYLHILQETPYCPTHFFDRALCAEYNYRGLHVAFLGIACDHFNGGTAGGVVSQDRLLRKWLTDNSIPYAEKVVHQVLDPNRPAIELPTTLDRPDVVGYRESERRFLERYRDKLGMVPYFVNPDYSHTYWSHNGRQWIPRSERCPECRWNRACLKHMVPTT